MRLLALLVVVGCSGPLVRETTVPHAPAPPADTRRSAPIVTEQPPTLRIASWNVKRLGHGHKDLDAVANVLNEFDLVAVQEVMTREVVEALLEPMPTHRALLTDTPTPSVGKHREFFAFFYDAQVLDPVLNAFVPDPEDLFLRDPYLACFQVIDTSDRLCLLTVHIVWGESVGARKAEVLALDDALRWAQEGDDTSSWVLLGDFNRPVDGGDADDEAEEEWVELLDRRGLRVPVVLAGPEVPTTLGHDGYANSYDHVFVSDNLADNLIEAGRFDIVQEVCAGNFETCRTTVSDHAPVYVVLDVPHR